MNFFEKWSRCGQSYICQMHVLQHITNAGWSTQQTDVWPRTTWRSAISRQLRSSPSQTSRRPMNSPSSCEHHQWSFRQVHSGHELECVHMSCRHDWCAMQTSVGVCTPLQSLHNELPYRQRYEDEKPNDANGNWRHWHSCPLVYATDCHERQQPVTQTHDTDMTDNAAAFM